MSADTCNVRTFLNDKVWNGDRTQFEIVLADPTRHHETLARSVQQLMPDITGSDILKHRHRTCACYGFED